MRINKYIFYVCATRCDMTLIPASAPYRHPMRKTCVCVPCIYVDKVDVVVSRFTRSF
jgi:hypothetical protein